jgi:hypothetical protein
LAEGAKTGDVFMKTMTEQNIEKMDIPVTSCWDELCGCMAETFRFTEEEKNTFSRSAVAQLIATLPFEASCDEPARTALAHLAIYMTELRGGRIIGDHTPADNESPMARLRLLASFKGGKKEVLEHGMNLLALVMVSGYIHSREYDQQNGIYNPFNDGSWDADKIREELLENVRMNPVKTLDNILPEVLTYMGATWTGR